MQRRRTEEGKNTEPTPAKIFGGGVLVSNSVVVDMTKPVCQEGHLLTIPGA